MNSDDDGIGDIPYTNLTGAYGGTDNFPIWNDGIDLQGGFIKINGSAIGVGAYNWLWDSGTVTIRFYANDIYEMKVFLKV